jgi:hypothetical protein
MVVVMVMMVVVVAALAFLALRLDVQNPLAP